jgi:glycosyltransferase involved in cell wall biosynthesis
MNHPGGPDLSLIMPCYNEEDALGFTVPRLLSAFDKAGYRLELVLVDNGSRDRTGEIIRRFAARHPNIVPCRVEHNQGYGYGVLSGVPLCTGPWIGTVAADGQVDAEDIVRLYEAAVSSNGKVLAKVRRRFRMDGPLRKVISVSYNTFVRLLWPRLQSIDINGNPRLLPREVLVAMNLKSTDWFIDPEMMIKAHYLGLRVLELNVFARMRSAGFSHVRAGTCWEFFCNLLRYRFSSAWKAQVGSPAEVAEPRAEAVIAARK